MTHCWQTSAEKSTHCSPNSSLFSTHKVSRPVSSSLTSSTAPNWTSEDESDEGDNRENQGLRERTAGNSSEGRERERLQGKIETLHAANLDLEAEIRFKTKAVERLSLRMEETREEKDRLLGEIQDLESTVKQLECDKSDLQVQLAAAQASTPLSPSSDPSEALEAELAETKKRLNEVISRYSEAERKRILQFTQLENEVNRLSALTSKLNHKSKQTEIELKAAKEQIAMLSTDLQLWKAKSEQLSEKLERVKEETAWEKEEKWGKLIEEKGKLKAELEETLWELEREREGQEGSLQEELARLEEGEWGMGRNSAVSTETAASCAEFQEKKRLESEELRVQKAASDQLIQSLQQELADTLQEAICAKVLYAQAATDLGLLQLQLQSVLRSAPGSV